MTLFTKTLFSGHSPHNGEVKVVESFGERRLIAAGYTQSRSLNKDGLTGAYWDGFIRNIPDLGKDSRVLILGLGGGTIAKLLTKRFGPIAIDGIEIDPLMVELGQKYLNFTEKNVKIIYSDALKYLNEARYKYDLIAVDLFAHGDVAVGAESEAFFKKVKQVLNKDAVVVVNKIFSGREQLQSYVDFIEKVFNKTDIMLVRGSISTDNVIVYAYV